MKLRIRALLTALLLLSSLTACAGNPSGKPLPPPSADPESLFGVDQNINMTTIDAYLGRTDAVYRDMRMLFDPAAYESIGGEANLTRTIAGFKVVPFPYIATLQKLPVENAYQGETLFAVEWNADGTIASASPRYQESEQVLRELFPQDRAIFLMCGGGGYAGMMKTLLIELGWDANLLYNVGANWTYAGEHALELLVYPEEADGALIYATWRADYAYLDFSRMHPLA